MNVKDVALVPPDDSTMQVTVKASIDDQFATLAASTFAGRNQSAILFGSVEELLDSLGDLTTKPYSSNRCDKIWFKGSRGWGCSRIYSSWQCIHGSGSRGQVGTRRCTALAR